jgi:hypothetical protein
MAPAIAQSSAAVPTVVVAVAVLFAMLGSVDVAVIVAVFVMTVVLGVPALTLTTRVNEALAPAARLAMVQVTVPVPPTAGVEHDQPAARVNDTNVVLGGTASLSATLVAPDGPEFETPIE